MFGGTNVKGSRGINIKGEANGFGSAIGGTTRVIKTGKGVLTSIVTLGDVTFNIIVDGVFEFSVRVNNKSIGLLLPYSSSLSIQSNNTISFFAFFNEGSNNINDCSPSVFNYFDTVTVDPSLAQMVIGKGIINSIITSAVQTRLVVDGVVILQTQAPVSMIGINLRFKASVLFQSTSALARDNQMVYTLE